MANDGHFGGAGSAAPDGVERRDLTAVCGALARDVER